jgi:hypothetical protein
LNASNEERYTVKVVFRGLCLINKNLAESKLEFFLPEASTEPVIQPDDPAREVKERILQENRPFREHHSVLEFPQAGWLNPSSVTPRLVQVTKPTKEPVALYLLKRERIHFSGLYGKITKIEPPEVLRYDEERYIKLSDKLFFLGSDDENGFDQLPGYLCEVAEVAERSCNARTSLSVGEALTERRSRREQPLTWKEIPAPGTPTPLIPPKPPRERLINLDIVVRFTLPYWNPLQVTCEPLTGKDSGDERTFILRPPEASQEITVWIKNRELDAILLDSDALPDPYPILCLHSNNKDRDHALFVQLARRPELLTIPELTNSDAADCGSGCGCADGKP